MKQTVQTLSILIVLAMFSCAKPPQKFEGEEAYQIKTYNGNPNYADLHFWAAHPYKQDPSELLILLKRKVLDRMLIWKTQH
jgi:hypothetical protein